MFLRKSLKSFQLLTYRQKCLNWCQIVVNRRYLSEDNDNRNKDKDIEKVDEKSHSIESRKPEDRVINAKQTLNELIQTLKSKEVFGESDPRLKELLAKPTFHVRRSARNEEDLDKNEEQINDISDKIDERLVMAAKGIAKTLSGEESKTTENELLTLLRLQVLETNYAKQGKVLSKEDLTSLLGDIKVIKDETIFDPLVTHYKSQRTIRDKPLNTIEGRSSSMSFNSHMRDRRVDGQEDSGFQQRSYAKRWERDGRDNRFRGQQSISDSLMQQNDRIVNRVNLFSGEDIGIFDANMKESSDSPKMLIWDRLMEDELQAIVTHPPKNAFEEMIKWTEEGKLWKFPINNEQGLEEEEKVPFYEHVLLDHLLEGFPQKGPIRKFMELVVTGLSQNPYITVERKHATVHYYRNYFTEKEDMLKIAGAL